MLLNNKLNNCKGCEGLQATIEELDCFISDQGYNILSNKKFSLNKNVEKQKVQDAIRYKNILIKKSYHPGYLSSFNINDIINQAKQVIY